MHKAVISAVLFLSLVGFEVAGALASEPTVIAGETVWSGSVSISEDVLVLAGATLTIQAGTTVTVHGSESTQTQPEFFSPLTEITVRGRLVANGTPSAPVRFVVGATESQVDSEAEWAGIHIDGGFLHLSEVAISGAESGVTVMGGRAELDGAKLTGNRHGLVVVRAEASVSAVNSSFSANDYGVVLLNGAQVEQQACLVSNNRKQDWHARDLRRAIPDAKVYSAPRPEEESSYGSESLLGTVIWRDRVVVNGVVRIPVGGRLIIMPGTVVEFSRSDSNGDGIGENGLMVMGMLIAKGTAERPIIFRSAEKQARRGDWDAINIYASDGFQNLLEYCLIEDAYRAVHLHYSNVLINRAVLRHNYRGLQFQESLVTVVGSDIHDNRSAMRARDSELLLAGNRIYDNQMGPYLYRITGRVADNQVSANYLDGLRIREGALTVEENYLAGNRYGLSVSYSVFGNFSRNVLSDNVESGLTLKGTDRIDVAGNFIQGNGGNGISLLHSQALIRGNQISRNNERGIGVNFFNGLITENNLVGNTLYAIGLESGGAVAAPGNWYGEGTDVAAAINDQADEPDKGVVSYQPVRPQPVPFTWPLATIAADTVWEGEVVVPRRVDLNLGAKLEVTAGAWVKFAKGSSLWLYGNLFALGTPEQRIRFTADEVTKDDTYWDQLTTEKAIARFDHCDFENAYMAVHVHFSDVKINSCTFRNNESGVRFRGGPVEISDSFFEGNVYGIVSYFARGRLTGNYFTGNDIGILVRSERNRGLVITGNNISDNVRHNLRLGDFNQNQDVNAQNNWWGKGDPRAKIYDSFNEPGIGLVYYQPYATEPFVLKGAAGAYQRDSHEK